MSIPEKPTDEMTLLRTQEEFEVLLGRVPVSTDKPIPPFVIIYFTAVWCKACKKLDLDAIRAVVPKATWLKCDIDRNDYTAGYCGIKSIPTFLVIQDKKVVSQLGDNRTEKVVEWLKRFAD
jgi:thioredoxin-like negative regulator of GroEL